MKSPLKTAFHKALILLLLASCFGALGVFSANGASLATHKLNEGPTPIVNDGFESICPTPHLGTPDVPVANTSGAPAALTGGELLDADWELTAVEFYSDEAFASFVTDVSWSSNGGTYGSSRTRDGGGWGFMVRLDLVFEAMIFSEQTVIDFEKIYEAAGVTTTMVPIEPSLVVDSSCSPLWNGAIELPYQVNSTPDELAVRITLTRDAFIAEVPPELAALMSMALVGDTPIVLSFEPL